MLTLERFARGPLRSPKRKLRAYWRRGQSFVEFAILLPLLLLMLSGLVEFGFMLNQYLDLIDATREVARFASDEDPVHDSSGSFNPNPSVPPMSDVYGRVWANSDRALNMGGQISLDPSTDDVIVSLFAVNFSAVSARYPTAIGSNGGENGWQRWGNHTSQFSSGDMQTAVTNSVTANGGNLPPNTGVVLVEIFYDYHMIMGLPWITAFVPNPVTLHAYAMMPNVATEPTPTP
ncbi:MAG: TadE/TadG family type IV pilus assembly protein [Anaerolineales bacterium]